MDEQNETNQEIPQNLVLKRIKELHGRTRLYYVCTRTKRDSRSNKLMHCNFQIRKDRYKYQAHACQFESMDSFVYSTNANPSSINPLEEPLFQLIGTQNLSFRTCASAEFRNLIYSAILLGQTYPNRAFHINDFIYSRNKLIQTFIVSAAQLTMNKLHDLRGIAVLIIDSGTIAERPTFNIIVSNAVKNLKPVLFHTVRNFSNFIDSFIGEVLTAILTLQNFGIEISGVVSDNLRAQVTAFNHHSPKSIQQTQDIPIFRAIRRFPCQCHCISLVISDLLKQPGFEEWYNQIILVVNYLRTKTIKLKLKSTVPAICRTRWTNLYSILEWFCSNYNNLYQFLNNSPTISFSRFPSEIASLIDVMITILPSMYPTLLFYNELIMVLEADNFLACDCYRLYHEFINFFRNEVLSIDVLSCKDFGENFLTLLDLRLKNTADINLLRLFGSFTIAGRHLLREELGFIENCGPDILDTIGSNEPLLFVPTVQTQKCLKFFADTVLAHYTEIGESLNQHFQMNDDIQNSNQSNISLRIPQIHIRHTALSQSSSDDELCLRIIEEDQMHCNKKSISDDETISLFTTLQQIDPETFNRQMITRNQSIPHNSDLFKRLDLSDSDFDYETDKDNTYIPDDHYGDELLHHDKDNSFSECLLEDNNVISEEEEEQEIGSDNILEKESPEEKHVSLNQLHHEEEENEISERLKNSNYEINSDEDDDFGRNCSEEEDIVEQTEEELPLSNAFTNWSHDYLNEIFDDIAENMIIDNDQQPGNQFFDYITSDSARLGINYSGRRDNNGKVDIQSFWNYISTIPGLKNLSTMAFRFLSFPASEASAERCFSSQARVAGRDRFKTSRILEEARVSFVLNR